MVCSTCPNLNWDFVLYLEGEEPNFFLSELLILHVKTTCETSRMTYAATGQVRNLRINGLHVEVKFSNPPPPPPVAINQSCDQMVGQLMGSTNAEILRGRGGVVFCFPPHKDHVQCKVHIGVVGESRIFHGLKKNYVLKQKL